MELTTKKGMTSAHGPKIETVQKPAAVKDKGTHLYLDFPLPKIITVCKVFAPTFLCWFKDQKSLIMNWRLNNPRL